MHVCGVFGLDFFVRVLVRLHTCLLLNIIISRVLQTFKTVPVPACLRECQYWEVQYETIDLSEMLYAYQLAVSGAVCQKNCPPLGMSVLLWFCVRGQEASKRSLLNCVGCRMIDYMMVLEASLNENRKKKHLLKVFPYGQT